MRRLRLSHAASVLLSSALAVTLWVPWEISTPQRPERSRPEPRQTEAAQQPSRAARTGAPAAARLALPAPPAPKAAGAKTAETPTKTAPAKPANESAAEPAPDAAAKSPSAKRDEPSEPSTSGEPAAVVEPLQAKTASSETAAGETASGETTSGESGDAPSAEPEARDPEADQGAANTRGSTPAKARTENTEAVTVEASKASASAEDGGALLRLLEHGSGPGIAIAWPDEQTARRRLHERMRRCFGLRTALLDAQGKLWTTETRPGRPWTPDPGRYSGFVRRPKGYVAAVERTKARRIRDHHDLGAGARVVRLVPRHVDAALLAGLRRALGAGYRSAKRIRGRYALAGGQVVVTDLRADGRALAGRVRLAGCR